MAAICKRDHESRADHRREDLRDQPGPARADQVRNSAIVMATATAAADSPIAITTP